MHKLSICMDLVAYKKEHIITESTQSTVLHILAKITLTIML
jgi:hypothetical protein